MPMKTCVTNPPPPNNKKDIFDLEDTKDLGKRNENHGWQRRDSFQK